MEIKEFKKSVLDLFEGYEVFSQDYWKSLAGDNGYKIDSTFFREDEICFYLNKEKIILFSINNDIYNDLIVFAIVTPYKDCYFESSPFDSYEQLLDELIIFKELSLKKILLEH